MRYRLKKKGEDSLLDYMRRSHKTIAWLVRETGLSRMGVDNILKGATSRSSTENLSAIAAALEMQIDYDEQGLYFYLPGKKLQASDVRGEYVADPLLRRIAALPPAQRRLVEAIAGMAEKPECRELLDVLAEIVRLFEEKTDLK